MSGNRDLTGSAARHHEAGGNAEPRELRLPVGGDAARTAETEKESVNEAHGIRTASRDVFHGARSIELSRVVGARLVEEEKPKADLSTRTAADYLPPHLKAQLIAEGKLKADGSLVEHPPQAETLRQASANETKAVEAEEPNGMLGSLKRFFRKLF